MIFPVFFFFSAIYHFSKCSFLSFFFNFWLPFKAKLCKVKCIFMQKNPLSCHHCDNAIFDWVLNNCRGSRKQFPVFMLQSLREEVGQSAPQVMCLCNSGSHSTYYRSFGLKFVSNLMFFAALLTMPACNSIDSVIVALSMPYALNVSNNDFVVHSMCIIQLIRHSSPLLVWNIDCIN